MCPSTLLWPCGQHCAPRSLRSRRGSRTVDDEETGPSFVLSPSVTHGSSASVIKSVLALVLSLPAVCVPLFVSSVSNPLARRRCRMERAKRRPLGDFCRFWQLRWFVLILCRTANDIKHLFFIQLNFARPFLRGLGRCYNDAPIDPVIEAPASRTGGGNESLRLVGQRRPTR